MKITYSPLPAPTLHEGYVPVPLTADTMQEHLKKVLSRMAAKKLDALVIYDDREHGANYAYLTGFETRFEESLLVLHSTGKAFLMLGNENMKMVNYSFLPATAIHTPYFSLPNQPMKTEFTMAELLKQALLSDHTRIGCVGWKMFTSAHDDNAALFDIPAFIIDALRTINPHGELISAGDIFLKPDTGCRLQMNANEIAHYEYGAGLASRCIGNVLQKIAPGKTELELASLLSPDGQPNNVTTICAAGKRFTNAVVFPRNNTVKPGDPFSVTLGLRGGLTSRAGFAVENASQLPREQQDYMERVAIPYFTAAATWYSNIRIGMSGGELYDLIENTLPKATYGWKLNPGHYTGAEEWVSSPFFPGSKAVIQSGNLLQMDIIPSIPGYNGIGAEDGVAVMDESLQKEVKEKYPETYQRMLDRKTYMENALGIPLHREVFPLSDLCGYCNPFLLNKGYGLKAE